MSCSTNLDIIERTHFFIPTHNCRSKINCDNNIIMKKLKLSVGIAGIDKNKNTNKDITNLPHECGEDSFFITKDNTKFGIADGVGGWRHLNTEPSIDPGIFSRKLMTNAKNYCENKCSESQLLTPHNIIIHSHNLIIDDQSMDGGSSTVTTMCFDKNTNTLNVAQIGDSCYVIIRHDSVLGFFTQENDTLTYIPKRLIIFHRNR